MWWRLLRTPSALEQWVGFKPSTPIETGVQRFADWYRSFYGV